MSQLPDWQAFGARPEPVLPRRTPQIASYRPTTGLEDFESQTLAHSGAEFENAGANFAKAQEYQDTLRAEDAFTQLRQKQIDLTYGDGGFVNLKGGAAVNQPILKTYGDQFDQSAQQIAGGLDNGYQRELFQKRAAVSGLQLREDLVKHVAQQANVYQEDTLKSTLDTEVQNASIRWADPDAPILPLQRIYNMVDMFGERNGKPDVWREDIKAKATAAVYSGIIKQANVEDPGKAAQLLALHSSDITAGERAQLDSAIQSRQYMLDRRDEVQKARDEAENQRILKQAQDEQLNKYLVSWNDHKLTPTDVVNDATLSFPQKHVMLEMLQQQTQKQGEMKTDPAVFMDLLDRIHQPYSSKEKITDENQLLQYVKSSGGIDYDALQKLRKEVRDIRDPEQGPLVSKAHDLFKVAESDLTKTNNLAGLKDPKGDELLYEWKWEADKKIADWKQQGKDPMELFDPKNKDYLGNMLSRYRRTPMQIINDMAEGMRTTASVPVTIAPSREEPVPPPVALPSQDQPVIRKPGESAADYLKRRGK